MNKYNKVALALGFTISLVQANDTTSHTFFFVRPPFQSAMPEKVALFRDDIMHEREEGWGGGVQAVVFGGRSVKGGELGRYFLPFGKTCLNVVEFKNSTATPDSNLDPSRDVEARNFNIETVNADQDNDLNNAFRSTICFCPRQEVVGVGLTWKQAITRDDDGWPCWWFEVNMPIYRVRNTMNLTEVVTQDGGGAVAANGLDDAPRVANMIQAFAQQSWQYGRILGDTNLKHTGVSDLELKLGWVNVHNRGDEKHCHWDSYVGLVFPTGNRPQGKFVFEPIVGSNKHFGIMYGSNYGFDFWECGNHKIEAEFNINGRYLFRNSQTRSFQLKDKSWSQYIAMYANKEDALIAFNTGNARSGTSGINILTKCVHVSPRFSLDYNSALVWSYCNWLGEVGYNFYGRHGERVELKKEWEPGPQVQDITGLGNTNIARNIRNNFPASFIPVTEYTPIVQSDLNLDSAAHPAVISNIIYASLGYNWNTRCYPTFTALGGSYEFTHGNAALQRWLVWGKIGIAY